MLTCANGGETVALIPTRYPGLGGSRRIRRCAMARRTEWTERPGGAFVGLGQRMLATDAGEHAADGRRA